MAWVTTFYVDPASNLEDWLADHGTPLGVGLPSRLVEEYIDTEALPVAFDPLEIVATICYDQVEVLDLVGPRTSWFHVPLDKLYEVNPDFEEFHKT